MEDDEYATGHCSKCYEGEIVRNAQSGELFCSHCKRTVKLREIKIFDSYNEL